MLFTMEVSGGNAALLNEDGRVSTYAVSEILKRVAYDVDNGRTAPVIAAPILDDNGNRVGTWSLS